MNNNDNRKANARQANKSSGGQSFWGKVGSAVKKIAVVGAVGLATVTGIGGAMPKHNYGAVPPSAPAIRQQYTPRNQTINLSGNVQSGMYDAAQIRAKANSMKQSMPHHAQKKGIPAQTNRSANQVIRNSQGKSGQAANASKGISSGAAKGASAIPKSGIKGIQAARQNSTAQKSGINATQTNRSANQVIRSSYGKNGQATNTSKGISSGAAKGASSGKSSGSSSGGKSSGGGKSR